MFIRGIARNVVYGALWFLFLLYLERSRALDAAMSGERCDLPLWCVALMVVVLALAMSGVLPEPWHGRVRFILPAIGEGSFPGLRMAHFGSEVSEFEFFIVI